MIQLTAKGSFAKTEARLRRLQETRFLEALAHKYGQEGVASLAGVTPVDTSLTANSWTYDVRVTSSSVEIVWRNTNMAAGTPIAILLQYGHGTGTGGFVPGRDYINPVILPLFERIKADIGKAVRSA